MLRVVLLSIQKIQLQVGTWLVGFTAFGMEKDW